MDCDSENRENERGGGFYQRSTLRHALYCQVLTFSHHFTFHFLNLYTKLPSSMRVTFMWHGTSTYIFVWKVFSIVNNTKYKWIIFFINAYKTIIYQISYLSVWFFLKFNHQLYCKVWPHFAQQWPRHKWEGNIPSHFILENNAVKEDKTAYLYYDSGFHNKPHGSYIKVQHISVLHFIPSAICHKKTWLTNKLTDLP